MMLHQKRSGSLARLKYLTTLPLMAGMLCLSTLGFTKDYPVYDLLPKPPAKPLQAVAKPQYRQLKNATTQVEPAVPQLTMEDGIDLLKKDATIGGIKLHPAELTKESYEAVTNKIDSLFGPTSPLYIIDGVILTNQNANKQGYNFKAGLPLIISTIPQADIMSMEILKDATAAKLYGAKGANGVIIVTTKKGQNKSLFTPGAYPLIYVDGQPFEYKESDLGFDENGKAKSALSLIPQENIALMHVYNAKDGLKEFGPAGADGVIFITTVQGQAKKAETNETIRRDSDARAFPQFYDYIEKNVRYPTAARDKSIQGKVFVQFNINPDNTVTNMKLLRGLTDDINNEVMRVIKTWKAPEGLSKDRNFTLPVIFTLENQDTGKTQPEGIVPKKDPEPDNYVPNNFKTYMLKETVVRGYIHRTKE